MHPNKLLCKKISEALFCEHPDKYVVIHSSFILYKSTVHTCLDLFIVVKTRSTNVKKLQMVAGTH
eukprot:4338875-Amphidinium_carterae.1